MTDTFFGTSGPRDAKIMVVAESWGSEEERQQLPLVGASGQEFTRIFGDAGINRNEVFLTNVIGAKPDKNEAWRFFDKPKTGLEWKGLHPTPFVISELTRLAAQIEAVNPTLIIAMGNYALWALTDKSGHTFATDSTTNKSSGVRAPNGIMSWRGSQLYTDLKLGTYISQIPVLPIIHPAAILRQWELRATTVHDLRARVPLALNGNWDAPQRTFITPTSQNDFGKVIEFLHNLQIRVLNSSEPKDICVDIETKKPLLICIGIAVSTTYAISIPLVTIKPDGSFDSFWTTKQEAAITLRLRWMLSHRLIRLIGQNFIYDTQYLEAEYGSPIKLHFDTMLAQHLLFPGTPKGLDYLSSLYCEHHVYWKDDGKDWHVDQDLQRQLLYNCEDCVRTLECYHALDTLLDQMNMRRLWQEELDKHELALRMMRRGVRINTYLRQKMRFELMSQQTQIEQWLLGAVPQELVERGKSKSMWYDSAQQTKFVLYDLFNLPRQQSRFTGSDTTGKEGIGELKSKFPRLGKLFDMLSAYRSLGVFQRNFINKPLEPDQRMRTQFNPAGTETFRWSSSENAFGRGTNLQNIPSGNEDEE